MASQCPHLPIAVDSKLHLPVWEGGPSRVASTWQSVQTPIHTHWPDLALLTKTSYLDEVFPHLPRLSPGKGQLTTHVWWYIHGTAWPQGRSPRIPLWHWYLGSIGLNQCIGAKIHSSLLLSVHREEGSVSKKVVVPNTWGRCWLWCLDVFPQPLW